MSHTNIRPENNEKIPKNDMSKLLYFVTLAIEHFEDSLDISSIRNEGLILKSIKISFKDGTGFLSIINRDLPFDDPLPYGEVSSGYNYNSFTDYGELKTAIRHAIKQKINDDDLDDYYDNIPIID